MSESRIAIPDRIIEDIEKERGYAAQYWNAEFDSKNTVNDWAAYINNYLSDAVRMRGRHPAVAPSESVHEMRQRQRKALVKVANLAVSALEAFDDNDGFQERHYDD